MATPPRQGLVVTSSEQGMKILRFLERRTDKKFPLSMLHKWIRGGQVRVNAKRTKAFFLLQEGDVVRIPPFAFSSCAVIDATNVNSMLYDKEVPDFGSGIEVIHYDEDLLVLNKDSGIPVQPGSGHTDSIVQRLALVYAKRAYTPAPAHRIDRSTSGLVLAGMTHKNQQNLHAWFSEERTITKEYLAWVAGDWGKVFYPSDEHMLEDLLDKNITADGKERVITTFEKGKRALSFVHLLETRLIKNFSFLQASLLHIRLETGRKHQIRVQLSSRGYPIVGDKKYGGERFFPMLLHAFRLTLPGGKSFFSLPNWESPFNVSETLLKKLPMYTK